MDNTTKWMIRAACGVVLLGAAGVVALVAGSFEGSRRSDAVELCKLRTNYKGYQRLLLFDESRTNMNKCLSEFGLKWKG